MSLIKQIEDKGAVFSWSPLLSCSNLIALGTKDSSGSGFEDHGGDLELHSLNFRDSGLNCHYEGKVRASTRFSSLAWSSMSNFELEFSNGLIAGGMIDGVVNVWNPASILGGKEDSLLVSLDQHQGSVSALHFNPHKESTHLLATGGSDGEVYVISLDKLETPAVFIPAPLPNTTKHTADITQVSWNSQVAHILASAAQNGSCFIWDLRQKRAWCELRDPTGGSVADIAWNPDQGLHIITASGDDKNPVLKLWDLRSSTSLPLATLSGHTEGILSINWCPFDTSLLISCGKDSKTIIWDLFHLQPVYELPLQQANLSQDSSIFNSFASNASNRRHHVSWSPCIPAVLSTSSFDRKIQFYSLSGFHSKAGRAPRWLRRTNASAFGFGGRFVVVDNRIPSSAAQRKVNAYGKIHVYQITENAEVINQSDDFHSAVSSGRYKDLCEAKASVKVEHQSRVWRLMRVICFGENAREELLTFLGFDNNSINIAGKLLSSSSSAEAFEPSPTRNVDALKSSVAAEPTIRNSLIVGNFEMAVECCLAAGLLAEALLLAQCGGPELKANTQAAVFKKQMQEHSFLSILNAVIKGQLMEYVNGSNLSCWKETLALLSTYGKSDEFPRLCEALARRLETERRDKSSAVLCYMCAANVERTIQYWTEELEQANSQLGQVDVTALQDYVEKVLVFSHANPVQDLGPECGAYFAQYAEILASQGRFSSAANYLRGESLPIRILADRIYHAGSKPAGSRPPVFPFEKVTLDGRVTENLHGVTKLERADPTEKRVQSSKPAIPSVSLTPTLPINSDSIRNDPLQLPSGWLELYDPLTKRPYFANQITGQSQWEPPALAPVELPTKVVVSDEGKQQLTVQEAESKTASVVDSKPQTLVNVGNYADSVIALGQMIEAIAAGSLNSTERKQITMLRSNYQVLSEKLQNNELSQEILEKLSALTDHLVSRNYSGANLIQTELVNTAWSQHKEWLKGIKILIQLASKK